MDTETVTFLRQLAAARAREAPARLRPAACRASIHRWTGMLAAQRAYAMSLLELPLAGVEHGDGDPPPWGDLLADARGVEPIPDSRLR